MTDRKILTIEKFHRFIPIGSCCECGKGYDPDPEYNKTKFIEFKINEYASPNHYEIRIVLCEKCFNDKLNEMNKDSWY